MSDLTLAQKRKVRDMLHTCLNANEPRIRAWYEGMRAASLWYIQHKGAPGTAHAPRNPFPPTTLQASEWNDGWHFAREHIHADRQAKKGKRA